VVDGRIFVLSAAGRVYSLDAKSGCTYWTFDVPAGAHSSIFIGELSTPRKVLVPAPPRQVAGRKGQKPKRQLMLAHLDVVKAPTAAFFGDDTGAIYALDAQKGTLLWKTQVDSHPQAKILGAPTLFHDRLYVVVGSSEQSAAQDNTYACCTFRGSVAALEMTCRVEDIHGRGGASPIRKERRASHGTGTRRRRRRRGTHRRSQA
jgi:polyvinyl alcohol dehydrogenase (cytochrome)